ncbi:MAG: HAMP domain-containing sensor histidine kinase [Gammaproteobacteria bacterium]|nr:HAMP domain-containing sensor histidine kinase [Gammaproteobacteria bacterium]
MKNRRGLRHRLGRAFALQALLISAVAFIGVYAAAFTIEEILIKQALVDEADYFWQHYEKDPGFARPDTRNLTGYLSSPDDSGGVPSALAGLEPGFHKLPSLADFSLVYVTERDDRRLFLLFDGEQVGELALYFGLFPLAAMLIVLYLAAWLAYRLAGRAISPIVWLAREVDKLDPDSAEKPSFDAATLPGNPDAEVLALVDALNTLSQRIEAFVERERNFTRDSSHELRSPLTVIKIAADMLLSEQDLDHRARNSVLRIKRAATDMEELTEAFLLLARESELGLSTEPVCVNQIVEEEVDREKVLLGDKPVEVGITAECALYVTASEKVLCVLIANLVRNAFQYTDAGRVQIHVSRRHFSVEDSGVGISGDAVKQLFQPFFRADTKRRGGHGVGLTIVKRLSDRFGWPLHIDSTPGVGTRVVVEFPGARAEELHAPPEDDPGYRASGP